MDKDELKKKRDELLSQKTEHPESYFEIKFRSGYEKKFQPGQKYNEVNTVEEIVKSFRDLHEDEWTLFRKTFGFGLEEIEEIGIEKYIEVIGWTNRFQVGTWKTDKFHVLICPHCKADFGIWELSSGLCESCKPHFLYQLVNAADLPLPSEERPPMDSRVLFLLDPNYRELFRKNPEMPFEKAVSEDNSELMNRLIANRFLQDIALISIASENDVSLGIARLHYFPMRKIESIIRECMLADRVKVGNPKFSGLFDEKIKFFNELIKTKESPADHCDIYSLIFDNPIQIARLQKEKMPVTD